LRRFAITALLLNTSCSCQTLPQPADAGFISRPPRPRPDVGPLVVDAGPLLARIQVQVLLDGLPVEGAVVLQGGTELHLLSDAQGMVELQLDPSVIGDKTVVASHPEARTGLLHWHDARDNPSQLHLTRFDSSDNADYRFQDPGQPGRRASTRQCGHCHVNINDDWYASPHRQSASNPIVQDQYAGTSSALSDESECLAAGGRWLEARSPGPARAMRCFIGDGQLSAQPDCVDATCLENPTGTGKCADCHAPAMDGIIGGRDLLDAPARALRFGVSCDLCHRVSEVVPEAAAGVGNRLQLMRPSEEGDVTLGADGLLPLTFGPSHDSPNVRMGSVQRDHFQNGQLCMGCHQYEQRAGSGIPAPDPQRWPDGKLPVHSTYQEWKDGVFGDKVGCNACHMPPDADVLNAADHQLFPESETGVVAGWLRPPGSVRRHTWFGPRQPESGLLELAASLFISKRRDGDTWLVEVRTVNSGCGHALPTGEPQRQVLLQVSLRCGDEAQEAIGGEVLPAWAGALANQETGSDWRNWPSAEVGDHLVVTGLPGGYRDYEGIGAFAGDNWNAQAKGIALEEARGKVRITAVEPDGRVETDAPIPSGDRVYLLRGEQDLAGLPGVGFARVMVNAAGDVGVHHSQAVDLLSDNRLMPQASWTSNHRFRSSCEQPIAHARLIHRNLFYAAARAKSWPITESLITEVER
jgi:hypothetical protein